MISEKAEALFDRMEKQCDSQARGVVDCLRGIAENGGDQETDTYLAVCANEMAEWANTARNELRCLDTEENREAYMEDWRYDVANRDTRLGFVDWLWHNYDMHNEPVDDEDEDEEGDTGDTQP